jgi:hypothetical protein
VLINRSTTLASGQRIRLRLPHGSDRGALRALHARAGQRIDDRDASRLMGHDPRLRAVVCAVGWTADGQAMLGFAAGDAGAEGPDVLVVDPAAGTELAAVLTRALAQRTGPAGT